MIDAVKAFAEQLATYFDDRAAKAREKLGVVDDSLVVAACWDAAASKTRQLAAEFTDPDPDGRDMTLTIDLHHDLLTTARVAELAFGPTDDPTERRRNQIRINVWRHREHLAPVTDADGKLVTNEAGESPVYLGIDVLRCVAEMAKRDPRQKGNPRRRKHDEAGRGRRHGAP